MMDMPADAARARAREIVAPLYDTIGPWWCGELEGSIARALVEAERDDPESDCTDAAHPAWWRGHAQASAVWAQKIQAWFEGRELEGTHHEPWQTIRARIAKLAEAEQRAQRAEAERDEVHDESHRVAEEWREAIAWRGPLDEPHMIQHARTLVRDLAAARQALERIATEEWDDMDPDDGLHNKSARVFARDFLKGGGMTSKAVLGCLVLALWSQAAEAQRPTPRAVTIECGVDPTAPGTLSVVATSGSTGTTPPAVGSSCAQALVDQVALRLQLVAVTPSASGVTYTLTSFRAD